MMKDMKDYAVNIYVTPGDIHKPLMLPKDACPMS
jgi:hypothetical protein